MQSGGQSGDETFLRERPVSELAAFVVHHDPHNRPEPLDDPFLLTREQGGRTLHVEGQLDSGCGLIGVLATRPTGRAEPDLELGEGNLHGAVDPKVVIGHLPMLAYPARQPPPGIAIAGTRLGWWSSERSRPASKVAQGGIMNEGHETVPLAQSRRVLGLAVGLLVVMGLFGAWYIAGRDAGDVSTGASKDRPSAAASAFWGHRWQIQSRSDGPSGAATFNGPDGGSVLDTTKQGVVSFTGCNGGSGSASVQGRRLVVGDIVGTEMACTGKDGESLMAFDAWMATFLSSGPTISVDGDRLTLTTDAFRVVLRDLGPGAPTPSTDPGSPDEPVSNTPTS